MKMKNIRVILVALVGMLAVSCYNDFDTPAPAKIWSDNELDAMGLTHVTIKQVKDQFGELSNRGTNSSWSSTNTLKLGLKSPLEEGFVGMEEWPEAAGYYIKGKVISSDAQGNVYKSLFIDDGTAGIELKLSGTLFTTYHLNLGTLESQWVYVRLKDLYLGNYRMMLSIGDAPSMSYNAAGVIKYYANSNIEIPQMVDEKVLPGERVLLDDSNITVVNNSSYTTLGEPYFGRLVRFEGVKICYAGVEYQNEELIDPNAENPYASDNIKRDAEGKIVWGPTITKPNVTSGGNSNPYPNWIVTDERQPQFGAWYHWAYSRNNDNLYGSVLMTYLDGVPQYNSLKGVYSIRTSGFSRFGMKPIPRDGVAGNVLGIYGIYASRSEYTGDSNDWAQYQITVSRIEDLDFPPSMLLSEAWIAKNTPAASFNPPVKDGNGDVDGGGFE